MDPLVERIARFVRGDGEGRFEELALEAFRFQIERIAPYRGLCERRGLGAGAVSAWRDVPVVPALAFKSVALAAEPAVEIFRSSGTTSERRSVHHHPYPDLYRTVVDSSFPGACLGGLARPPVLSLIPPRAQLPDSSLSFMADHIATTWGGEPRVTAFGPRGLEVARARSFLAARQRDRRAALILTTTFALAQLLEALERRDLRFRLPVATRVFETGGYKGRFRELTRAELERRGGAYLGLAPEATVLEYGMTELTSQFYAAIGPSGRAEPFRPPPWTRVRILDPVTLAEVLPGQTGLVTIFDLANVGSAVHVLTEDLGLSRDGGFELAGRATGAELRGCSLVADELAG